MEAGTLGRELGRINHSKGKSPFDRESTFNCKDRTILRRKWLYTGEITYLPRLTVSPLSSFTAVESLEELNENTTTDAVMGTFLGL